MMNTIIAYVRNAKEEFVFLGEFPTGGRGGIDPLLSENSVFITPSKKFLLNVNAGDNTVTVFRILSDFKLRRVSIAKVAGTGPVAITVNSKGHVYVARHDFDGKFESVLDATGSLTGFRLTDNGKLVRIAGSVRRLPTRPGDVVISPDGNSVLYLR